jgi:hypothetical protein
MPMHFTATVKKGEVVIRDVPYADGDIVSVTIEPQLGEWEPTPEELKAIEEGEADIAAGRVRPINEFLEELRQLGHLRRENSGQNRARGRPRGSKVGASRPRTKSASGRGRSRK